MTAMHSTQTSALLAALKAIGSGVDPDRLTQRAREARVHLPVESVIYHRLNVSGPARVGGARAYFVPEARHDELARLVQRLME